MVKGVRVKGKIFIRKRLSLRTIPRACERESEAISYKAATAWEERMACSAFSTHPRPFPTIVWKGATLAVVKSMNGDELSF